MANYVLGIDFGEDSCVIAVAKREGGILIIQNDFKCVVAFGENQRIFGEEAKHLEGVDKKNTITGIRNLIGRNHSDPDVQEKKSFQTTNEPDGRIGIKVHYLKEDRTFTPMQITGMLFAKLKQIVEKELKTDVTDAVIGVPCFFDDIRREAVCNAARIAGLNVLEIMNETTANALDYAVNAQGNLKMDKNPKNVVFLNVGNIALQVSIMKIENGSLSALATSADPKYVSIIDNIHHMDRVQIKETMDQCLNNSGINVDEIYEVVVVGGSSQNTTVWNVILEVFKKQPLTMNQNEAVARGCALKAAALTSGFQNSAFKIEEVKPTIPELYKASSHSLYPKELPVGGLIKLMKIEAQLIKAENDERSRLEAKKNLEDYLEQLKTVLDGIQISEDYSKSLNEAIEKAEDLIHNEEANIQREALANILDEFKKHEELIENEAADHIYYEEVKDGQVENEDGKQNLSDEIQDAHSKVEEGSHTNPKKVETPRPSSLADKRKMFENQGGSRPTPPANKPKPPPKQKSLFERMFLG